MVFDGFVGTVAVKEYVGVVGFVVIVTELLWCVLNSISLWAHAMCVQEDVRLLKRKQLLRLVS